MDTFTWLVDEFQCLGFTESEALVLATIPGIMRHDVLRMKERGATNEQILEILS